MADHSQDIEKVKEYYADLLILQYKNKPRARQTIETMSELYLGDGVVFDLKDVLDIDNAVGAQLDLIGDILDCPRIVPGVTTDIDFFSFEKENAFGFSTVGTPSKGYFKDISMDYRSTYSLLDDEYRQLLKFKAVANRARASWAELDDLFFDVFNIGYKFDKSKFTIVGSPTITDDGIASGFSTSNAICVSSDLINYQADNYEIDIPFIYNSSSQSTILQSGSSSNYKIAIIINTNKIALFLGNGNSWTIANLKYGKSTLAVGTSYICKFIRKDGYYKINLLNKSTNTETEEISIQSSSLVPSSHYSTSFCSRDVYTNGWGIGNLTCNLAELKYFVDGVEVFSGMSEQSAVSLVNNKDLSITYNIKQAYLNNAIRACITLGYFEPPIGIGYNINYV